MVSKNKQTTVEFYRYTEKNSATCVWKGSQASDKESQVTHRL